jgi:hypothetical protein
MNMRWRRLPIGIFIAAGLVAGTTGGAAALRREPPATEPVTCAALTAKSAVLTGQPGITSSTSRLVAATDGNAAFCQVDILYSTMPDQRINIRVGLPLNSIDGGHGGIEGSWNGRTQGIGGSGCSGNLNVSGPVNAGYVGSGSDAGHTGGDCEPGVKADGTYDVQFINDFIRNGMKQQILLSKAVASVYYARKAAYNYWNGCSTGGRQGYLLAQELPDELEGIVANAPAINWTRFQTAQMWGQIVMKELTGGPIAPAKLAQVTTSAIAACDANDGVADGVIDDPRSCTFSAAANVCGAATAPSSNCLTIAEAQAIDRIWDGPRNRTGDRLWYGIDRGTAFALSGVRPFALGVTQFHWDMQDRAFDWQTVSMDGYANVAQAGSRNIADLTDTVGNLDAFKRHGGKLVTFVGTNDQLIMPRGVIHYYRQLAVRTGGGKADFPALQSFYRLYRAPGVGHCGGGVGPQPTGVFDAMVDWVERGKAPASLKAQTRTGDKITRERPLCPYPQTAVYHGSGNADDPGNFRCGGNLETIPIVCDAALVTYKQETDGAVDYAAEGADRRACLANRRP